MLETLKIMSTSRIAYTMGYFISQGIFVILTAVIVSLGFNFSYSNPVGDSAPVSVLFFGVIMFGLALMSLSMVLSTVFTDSKLSAQVGMFFILLPSSIFLFCISQRLQLVVQNQQSTGYQLFQLSYILPNFSFGIILLDFYIKGGPTTILDLDVTVAWVSLVLIIPVYVALYIYLDAIMPNVYGIRQSCCFCLRKQKVKHNYKDEDDEEAIE